MARNHAVKAPFLVSLLVLASFQLPGCGSTMLLEKDVVKGIHVPPALESRVIYCTDDFTPTVDGMLLEKKYVVIRIGAETGKRPRFLSEFDNASRRVINIEGRVIRADGSDTRIPPGAFFRVNLSDEQVIAEQYVRSARIPDGVESGDLVELVSLVEHTFPRLGILFSPAELGYPSDNVTSSIEAAPGEDIQYQVVNANLVPTVQSTPAGGKKYVFAWPTYRPPAGDRHPMAQRNRWPLLLAAPASQSWVSFGDWYLNLVSQKLTAGKALADTTARILTGKTTAREKMDAIFDYCRRTIRYEQVYLDNGEFIPNAADLIFSRRFGDCKDYATLMHAMASTAGVPTEFVLCYRGRGTRIYEQVPVSQFNHAILHFNDNGKDCWYDATDRIGLYGAPSFDLANGRALIIDRGRSRFATMHEVPENRALLSGMLGASPEGNLSGVLALTFSHQYAVELSWAQEQLNTEKMRLFLARRLKDILNDDLLVDSLGWHAGRNSFTARFRCTVPNCLSTLDRKTYVALSRIFPNLLPEDIEEPELREAFFFPSFNRVALDLTVTGATEPLGLKLNYGFPAGPFDDATRPDFLSRLAQAHADYVRPHIMKGQLHP